MVKHMTLDADHQAFFDNIANHLKIDVSDLQTELANHSSAYAYFATILSSAKAKRENLKAQLDQVKNMAMLNAKVSHLLDDTGKPINMTDSIAKAYSEVADDVLAVRDQLAIAEEELTLWTHILNAFYQRSYMLTHLAQLSVYERATPANAFNADVRNEVAKSVGVDPDYSAELNRKARREQVKRAQEIFAQNEQKGG